MIYSHHHYDHIAGGKPFKQLGARFIAHKNAKARLVALKYPDPKYESWANYAQYLPMNIERYCYWWGRGY